MNCEMRNLFRYCSNPFACGRIISFFIRRIIFSFQYRYSTSISQYPKKVQEVFSGAMKSNLHNFPSPGPRPPSPLGRGEGEGQRAGGCLKLATGFLEYDGDPDWQQRFDDLEQTMSLHRWHWLIYGDKPLEWGLALMRSWLSVMGPIPYGVGGTSYTTGERIVNALLFFQKKQIKVPEDLRIALLTMAWHLAKNLEYHGARGTGNHVVNNARALFFAGQIFNVKPLSELAFAILKDALPWLITKDGFLREESSHYHLLFTRWLIEIYELAIKTDDQIMQAYLKPWIKICAPRCWFFLVKNNELSEWQMPLIGDVSPDCTPEWLLSYLLPKLLQYKPVQWPAQEVQAFSQSGWWRLDLWPITIFWHVSLKQMIHRATHGHSDLCSFVVFWKGEPILIDPGRPTYQASHLLYQYSGSARAHNSLTIDDFGPLIDDRAQKFPVFYQPKEIELDWKKENKVFGLSITHTGFHRIQQDFIDHTRSFRVGDNFLEVEDKLCGHNQHILETFFHWTPEIKALALNDNQYEAGPLIFTVNAQCAKVIDYSDWNFPKYGEKTISHSLLVRQCVGLPLVNSYRFQW